MHGIGVQHVGVADTIGVGTPAATQRAMEAALAVYPVDEVSGHFHDTYGQALANVYASLEMGIATFDASVAGLGGCPYAKGATGNVATEDVVYLLQASGSRPASTSRSCAPRAGTISQHSSAGRRARASRRRSTRRRRAAPR